VPNVCQLHGVEPPATAGEVHAAALQHVREVAQATPPPARNAEAFDRAVLAVAAATQDLLDLLDLLVTSAPPKDREVEAGRARERSARRFAS